MCWIRTIIGSIVCRRFEPSVSDSAATATIDHPPTLCYRQPHPMRSGII